MALTDNLKDNNIKKIIIVELNYVDLTTNTNKKIFMSDSFCLYKKTSESVSLLTPEPRLESIPSFVKEIDLIKNEIIVKSSYSLKVNNKDNFYTQLLIDNFFDNQLCKIYITTENDLATTTTNGEYKVLSSGIIESIKTDDDLSINLKELDIFEKDLAIVVEFYTKADFTNLPKDLETEISPVIQGKLLEYKIENINYGDESTMYDTNLTASLQWFAGQNHWLTLSTNAEADRLSKMLKVDDLVYIADNNTGFNTLPGALKYVGRSPFYENVLLLSESEYQQQITLISNKKVYLQNSSIESNNTYFLTNTYDNSPYIFKNILSANYTTNSVVLDDPNGEFDILEDIEDIENYGEVIKLVCWYRFAADNYTTYKEDVNFSSYNKATKTLKFFQIPAFMEISKLGVPIVPAITNYKIGFEKVRSVRINSKNYKNQKKEIEIEVGDVSNFQTNTSSNAYNVFNTFAKISSNVLTFTNIVSGSVGNKNQIIFNNDSLMVSPYTPTLSSYTNSLGGTTYTINYYYFRDWLNNDIEVGTTISQLLTLFSGHPILTLTNSGTTSNLIGELNIYNQFLKGGTQSGSYWILNWATDKSILSATPAANPVLDYLNPDIAMQTLIEFQVGSTPYSNSELTTFKASLPANRKLIVVVQTGWTRDQVGQAISDKINYWARLGIGIGLPSVPHLNGIVSSYDSSNQILRIKHLYNHNIDISFDGYIGCRNRLNMYSNSPIFKQTIKNDNRIYFYRYITSDNFLINIDKVGLALSNDNPRTIGIQTTGIDATNGIINKRIKVNVGFKALNPGDLLVNGNPFGQFARYWNTTNSAIEIKMEADILKIYRSIEIEGDDSYNHYLNYKIITYNNTINLDIISREFYHVYPAVEIENVYVNFYNIAKTHIADIITELMAAYSITNYSSSDLTTLKTNHPFFLSYANIKENNVMYKELNKFLLSFNLYSYVDNNGILRFKFLDIFDKTNYKSIDFNTLSQFDLEVTTIENDSIKFNLMYNFNSQKHVEQKFTGGALDYAQTISNRYIKKEIQKDTNIMFNFLINPYAFNTKKYYELFPAKYFKKALYVNLILDMSNIELEIGDNIKIENNPDFDSSYVYKICKIETDFNNIKIKALKLL